VLNHLLVYSINVTDPYGRIIGSLDRNRYFSINELLNCTHEAEWTPFQIRNFTEYLVAPGIEPEPLDLYPETLATRPQRRSGKVYIHKRNPAPVSNGTQATHLIAIAMEPRPPTS
jgi:hypothetical protein